jgi:hypothetical protein
MSTVIDQGPGRELAVRYAFAVDRRSSPDVEALFTAEGIVVIPAALARRDGPTELRPDELIEAVARFERTRHVVEQHEAWLDGDLAHGETYSTAHHLYRRDGKLRDYAMALRYQDRFARTADGWRFTWREIEVDWVEDIAVRLPGERQSSA